MDPIIEIIDQIEKEFDKLRQAVSQGNHLEDIKWRIAWEKFEELKNKYPPGAWVGILNYGSKWHGTTGVVAGIHYPVRYGKSSQFLPPVVCVIVDGKSIHGIPEMLSIVNTDCIFLLKGNQ